MDEVLRRFRKAADQENRGRGTVRRPIRKACRSVRYWKARQRAGDGLRDVAAALGVAPWSLRRWMPHPATGEARFHRIHVEAEHVLAPAPGRFDFFSAILAVVAFIGIVRWKWNVIGVIAASALAAWLAHFAG